MITVTMTFIAIGGNEGANWKCKKTELLEYRVSNSIVDLFIFLVTDISIICSRNAVVIVFKARIRAS